MSTMHQVSAQLARLTLRRTATSAGSAVGDHASTSRLIYSLVRSSPSHHRNSTPLFMPMHSRRMSNAAALGPIAIGTLKPAQPKKDRKRVGRGPGSGRGGTATRGHKGQKARAGNGKPTPGFEGGQTPIMRRFPKRGFTNIFAKDYVPLNLGRIQLRIEEERLDPSKPITTRELLESGCIHSYRDGVKILADDAEELAQPIHLVVSRASSSAIRAIENAGGSIVCKYYTRTTLRALAKPHKLIGRLPPRDAVPVNKKDLLYYSDKANRGYLADRIPDQRSAKVLPDAGSPATEPAQPLL